MVSGIASLCSCNRCPGDHQRSKEREQKVQGPALEVRAKAAIQSHIKTICIQTAYLVGSLNLVSQFLIKRFGTSFVDLRQAPKSISARAVALLCSTAEIQLTEFLLTNCEGKAHALFGSFKGAISKSDDTRKNPLVSIFEIRIPHFLHKIASVFCLCLLGGKQDAWSQGFNWREKLCPFLRLQA